MSAEKSVEKLVNVQRFEPHELARDHSVSAQVAFDEMCSMLGIKPIASQMKQVQASLGKTILSAYNIGYERGYNTGYERGYDKVVARRA